MDLNPKLVKKNILIVDDTMSIRHLVKGSLRACGFNNILETGDGLNAQDILKKNSIDLVISDWEMPNMSGIELFESMQNNTGLKNVSFILLTQHSSKEKVTRALDVGITNYVVKPFTPEGIINKVIDVLQ